MRRSILFALLIPVVLPAQRVESPIARSLYLAFGVDPESRSHTNGPHAVSLGIEQQHRNSRWAVRLGGDYMRTASAYADNRREEIGAGITLKFGRRSGSVRPYLLAGVGIAQLRARGRWVKYDRVDGVVLDAVDSSVTSTARWNGVLMPGLGTDVRLGRIRLFGETRLNIYPASLSDRKPFRVDKGTRAVLLGVRL